jgi:hypothetical protein
MSASSKLRRKCNLKHVAPEALNGRKIAIKTALIGPVEAKLQFEAIWLTVLAL